MSIFVYIIIWIDFKVTMIIVSIAITMRQTSLNLNFCYRVMLIVSGSLYPVACEWCMHGELTVIMFQTA